VQRVPQQLQAMILDFFRIRYPTSNRGANSSQSIIRQVSTVIIIFILTRGGVFCIVGIRLHLSVILAAPEIHHKSAFANLPGILLSVTISKYQIDFISCQSGPTDLF
jgi:hypothetical protein